jgi:hypothetical protein
MIVASYAEQGESKARNGKGNSEPIHLPRNLVMASRKSGVLRAKALTFAPSAMPSGSERVSS